MWQRMRWDPAVRVVLCLIGLAVGIIFGCDPDFRWEDTMLRGSDEAVAEREAREFEAAAASLPGNALWEGPVLTIRAEDWEAVGLKQAPHQIGQDRGRILQLFPRNEERPARPIEEWTLPPVVTTLGVLGSDSVTPVARYPLRYGEEWWHGLSPPQ